MDLGVDLDVWPWIWLVVAVTFALLEVTVLGGSFILLPFAVSALAASILGFYDAAAEVQWAVFLFGGAVMWVGFYRWARQWLKDELPAGVGAQRPVGMVGIVTVALTRGDAARSGRVTVDGEVWGALTDDDSDLVVGTMVRVTAMRGTRAVIEPIESDQSATGEHRP